MRPATRGRPWTRARRGSSRFATSFALEFLESRQLLSTTPSIPSTMAAADVVVLPSLNSQTNPLVTSPLPFSSSLTPSQVASYYGFSSLAKTARGVTLDGAGETIAIVDAYNSPTIAQDLHAFDKQFGLADPPSFQVVNQSGSSTLPATDTNWALEIALDVEWAHAVAPQANILLVEANSSNLNDLLAGVQYAGSHANVVSMSWGSSEFRAEPKYDAVFNVPGVTFVAASGDDAGISGAEWPSSSPSVVSVGGTTLSGGTETAWSGSTTGSAGGVSRYEPLPSYQSQAYPNLARGRVTPDVAYVGNPSSGFAVYDSTTASGRSGWFQVGGTSAGAPQWAALFALADQSRAASGASALSSSTALGLLYGAAKTEGKSIPSPLFHDITIGRNAFYAATTGYDAVTGLGTPIANKLIPYLTTGSLGASASVLPSASVSTIFLARTTPNRQSHPRPFDDVNSTSVVNTIPTVVTPASEASPSSAAPSPLTNPRTKRPWTTQSWRVWSSSRLGS